MEFSIMFMVALIIGCSYEPFLILVIIKFLKAHSSLEEMVLPFKAMTPSTAKYLILKKSVAPV